MKLDLKSKKGKLILFGSIATVAVVATAIAVPVALLVPKNAAELSPLEQEVAAFNKLYSNALSISAGTDGKSVVTVNREAFLNRTDLPADFRIPSIVTAVAASAFKGAKLPQGFTIPAGVTSIDATAFSDVVFDEDNYWNNSKAEAGAKVDTLANNKEWKDFTALYANTLSGKSVVDDAFKGKIDLPADFDLPSFLTKIGARAFLNGKLPTGFQLPAGITSIGESALAGITLPSGFQIPKGALLSDLAFDRSVFPANFALPDEMTTVGFEGNAVSGKAIKPFNTATFAEGFTLKNTVTAVSSTTFFNAALPLDFTIPSAAKVYSLGGDGSWVSDDNAKLSNVILPDDAKWSDSSGAVPGAVIVAYPPAEQVQDFNAVHNNALNVSGDTITVKESAFKDRKDLPAGFRLPSSVTAIAANAFKGAKLPLGFKIPQGVTSIDPTAFADLAFDDDLYWLESKAEAGARVGALADNTEWKQFNTAYPGKLQGKALADLAFNSRTDLPAGFALPSFLTKIGDQALAGAVVPAGFKLPETITYIGSGAFSQVKLPDGFTIPKQASFGSYAFDRAVFPKNFLLPAEWEEIGFYAGGTTVTDQTFLFQQAVFSEGFTLSGNVKKIAEGAFTNATLPLGFEIPSTAKIFVVTRNPQGSLSWEQNDANTLTDVKIPDGTTKWSKGNASSGSKVVPSNFWTILKERTRQSLNVQVNGVLGLDKLAFRPAILQKLIATGKPVSV